MSTSREEKPMNEELAGAAQLLGNNLDDKVSDYNASGKGNDRSKKLRHEERVKVSSRKKEDAISRSRDEKPMKEEPVGTAQLLGHNLLEKVSDYRASEKEHERSKEVRHEEHVRDGSRKKEKAMSSSRDKKPMEEDPVGAVQLLGNNIVEKVSEYYASEIGHERSEELRREKHLKHSSRKKGDVIPSSREEKSMKEDHVGTDQVLSKDLVEKVPDYHVSQKGHDRSKKVRLEKRESSRKKEEAISSSREEILRKENPVGAAQLLGSDLVEKVSDYHESEKGCDTSVKLRREECVKDSSIKKEEAISSFREERLDTPKEDEKPAADRKRKAEGERSTAETKLVEEHIKDRTRKKEQINSSCREERLDKRIKKEDLAANKKMRVKGEYLPTEIETMSDRDGLVVDAKMKAKKESHTPKTTEKQIRHRGTGREQARNALESLPGSRKRLRNLVVADILRDEDCMKPYNENKRKNKNGYQNKNRGRNMSKRHDPGKLHSVEVSERWEKREQPKSHLCDMKEKRWRSRSPNHGKDRHRKSSPLPRAEKASSRHTREHEQCSENAVKGRSKKHHLNDYENKVLVTINNKSRRYSTSKSELGGYSPRKRREEASAKAASPPNLSSEKKIAKWDLGPSVTAGIVSGANFSGLQAANQIAFSEASLTLLKSFVEAPGMALERQTTSVDSVQLTESTRCMRRIYVENVPDSASEKSLIECFNGYMLSSGSNHIQGSQPCISCIINKEKRQALVEFLTPQDASAALSLDGCSFEGSNLNISRPNDYVETTSGELEKKEPATNAVSDKVEDSSNKIFVGGFPKAISSEMLMEIVSVFGPLKAFHYVSNNDLNQRCAFLEYTDGSVTLKACAGLNGMKLGGSVIAAVCAVPDTPYVEGNENPPFYGIPERAKPLLGKPKHILKLKNVVDPEDLLSLSKAEVKEILEDVRLECARFGVIKSINIVEHHSKDITGSQTNVSCNIESTDSKEMNVSVIQEKEEGSKKADDIEDKIVDTVRPDSLIGKDKLYETCTDAATETNTQANKDHHSLKQDNCGKIVGESAQYEAENLQEVGSMHGMKTRRDSGIKIKEEQDPKDVFELGCIFIEYRRPEATRDAAHSLHGRLYEKRIVKAEYVSRELYQIRYPSG